MSFSQDVRSHLAQAEPEKECCRRSLLLALLSVCAAAPADAEDGSSSLILGVENGAVARLLFRLAKHAFGIPPQLHAPEAPGRGTYRLVLALPEEGLEGAMSMSELQRGIRKRSCCRRAFLRGAFLGCGSIVDPERAYHLEFTAQPSVTEWIVALLRREKIKAGHYQRVGHVPWTCYVKRSEDIATFLTLVGAVPALLALEELLISRDLKNNVQRAVNCETANLDRTVSTAQVQIAAIQQLCDRGALHDLSPELRETADLRLEHPYASLAQLAELHSLPLSKSAVNHRLRKLALLAVSGPKEQITSPLERVYTHGRPESPARTNVHDLRTMR